MAAMTGFEKYVASNHLDASLLHLIKTRASQINGCAFCLDMHTKDARANGETEQRLYALNAWLSSSSKGMATSTSTDHTQFARVSPSDL